MPDNMLSMEEYAELSEALIRWLQSQDIHPANAVTTMCIVIGAIAGQQADTMDAALEGCRLSHDAMRAIAQSAFDKKLHRQH